VTHLGNLIPAAEEGWRTLFDLAERDTDTWLLVGGQMMYLLAAEQGAVLPRPTTDMDVVVNVRARPKGTQWLSAWLEEQGFELEGISTDGIGHRFVKPTATGGGVVIFDVLGPEGLGERTKLVTVPPARTVQAPGSTQAFIRSEVVIVTVSGVSAQPAGTGQVRRPDLLGALLLKTAATTIAGRHNPERDWQDAALLLTLIDPIEAAHRCDNNDRRKLNRPERLRDRDHRGWAIHDNDAYRLGTAALSLILDEA
jgi:hypothetical protein